MFPHSVLTAGRAGPGIMSGEPTAGDVSQIARRRDRLAHIPLSRTAQLVSVCFFLIAAGMVPWTVFLGLSLPPKYDAGHWNLLWTGFDVGLICVLGYAAWAAWFHRQVIATTAIVAGTLLLCDAWFDIITSLGHGDQWVTLLTGLGGELPLAIFFIWLYRRIVLASLATIHQRLGDGPAPRRLREAQIMFLSPRSATASAVVPIPDPPGPVEVEGKLDLSFTVPPLDAAVRSVSPARETGEE